MVRPSLFLTTFCTVLIALVLSGAAPVHAQHMSDQSGVNTGVNMSDMSGVSTDIIGVLKYRTDASFVSAEAQDRANAIAQRVNQLLETGSLLDVLMAASESTVAVLPGAPTVLQQQIGSLLVGTTGAARFTEELTVHGVPAEYAEVLLEALVGLTRNDVLEADRLVVALAAFNQVVDQAPLAFLNDPPDAFVVVHATLAYLSGAQPLAE